MLRLLGSIITDGDLLYNCSDEKIESIKAGTSEILTYVRLLHEASTEPVSYTHLVWYI